MAIAGRFGGFNSVAILFFFFFVFICFNICVLYGGLIFVLIVLIVIV